MPNANNIVSWAMAVLAVVMVVLLQVERVDHARTKTAHAVTKANNAKTLQDLSELTTKAYQAALAEDTRRNAQLRKIADDGQHQIDAARADARAADRAAGGLRKQLAAYVAAVRGAAGPSDPKPADAGPPASEAVMVLAQLLESADSRAGELAAAFDASYAAGITCERSYDTLKP
jgi:hypothetical protein